jgi:probable selenium-dependent hydroxylase accessory protein YqeC
LAVHKYIFLIGGGGKTTLMFTLARHLAHTGRTVVSTTSTRILYPPPSDSDHVLIEDDPVQAATRLRSELLGTRHVTIGKSSNDAARKLHGYTADELDYLRRAAVADYLIVEADGAAGKSIKAYNDYEPVVSTQADLVIAVIGSDSVGCRLTDAHVHRAARFSKLLNLPLETPITVEDIAAIFFHPLGYLKAVPPTADVMVLISKAGDASRRENARKLAAALHAADRNKRIAHILIGELAGPNPFLEPDV